MSLDFRALWASALSFHEFVAASTEHRGLWEGSPIAPLPTGRRAGLSAPAPAAGAGEDWCGDASNTIRSRQVRGAGAGARAAGCAATSIEVMDRYLTNGRGRSRS
jgi:hypothetical protein